MVGADFDHWRRAVYPRYWSKRAHEYGIDPYVTGLFALIRSVQPADTFELAIGNGYPFAAGLTEGGIAVTGCDISELLVQECAQLAPRATAYAGGYDDPAVLAAVAGRRFDVVYCFRSTWYFPDIEQAIRFMRQLAKPGGRVMFDIINSDARSNQDMLRAKRRSFPVTMAKNVIKTIVNAVRPGAYMLDQVFGIREIMHSPAEIEGIIRAQGLRFDRLTRGEIERGRGAAPTGDSDQKLIYLVQL